MPYPLRYGELNPTRPAGAPGGLKPSVSVRQNPVAGTRCPWGAISPPESRSGLARPSEGAWPCYKRRFGTHAAAGGRGRLRDHGGLAAAHGPAPWLGRLAHCCEERAAGGGLREDPRAEVTSGCQERTSRAVVKSGCHERMSREQLERRMDAKVPQEANPIVPAEAVRPLEILVTNGRRPSAGRFCPSSAGDPADERGTRPHDRLRESCDSGCGTTAGCPMIALRLRDTSHHAGLHRESPRGSH